MKDKGNPALLKSNLVLSLGCAGLPCPGTAVWCSAQHGTTPLVLVVLSTHRRAEPVASPGYF